MNPVIIVQGTTGSGKSKLAHDIASYLKSDIISADSRQIYKYCDIGTNKEKFEDVHTNLIDIKEPNAEYSAFSFLKDTTQILDKITSEGKIPVITGGTAFYIDILTGRQKLSVLNDEFKSLLADERILSEGMDGISLSKILKKLSPEIFNSLNESERLNKHRLIRRIAEVKYLQIHPSTDRLYVTPPEGYNYIKIGIDIQKDVLNEKIDLRVKKMIKAGLKKEVEYIYDNFGINSFILSTIGYKEFFDKENNLIDYDPSLIISSSTKKYAKRQMTWLKKDPNILWYKKRDDLSDKVISEVIKKIYR